MSRRPIVPASHSEARYRRRGVASKKRGLPQASRISAPRLIWAEKPSVKNAAASAQILGLPIGIVGLIMALCAVLFSPGTPGSSMVVLPPGGTPVSSVVVLTASPAGLGAWARVFTGLHDGKRDIVLTASGLG